MSQERLTSQQVASSVERLRQLPLTLKMGILLCFDAFAWFFSFVTIAVLRYDLGMTDEQWRWAIGYTLLAIGLQVILELSISTIHGRQQVGSFEEAFIVSCIVALLIFPVGFVMSTLIFDFPRALAIIMPPLALIYMAAARGVYRLLQTRRVIANNDKKTVRTLVYGAGEAGYRVAELVDHADDTLYDIVGFIDDSPGKQRLRLGNYKVRGTGEDLVRIAQERQVDTVILAITKAPAEVFKRIASECTANGLDLVVIPPVQEMIGGKVSLDRLRQFNVADLLGRRPIETDLRSIADYVMGKRVLVTGAGGSIGSELARQVYKLGPSKLILLDRDESELHAVRLSIDGDGLLDTDDVVLCDIRDQEALNAIFEDQRPQVVFHAAALKHLPMLERYPLEGWKTNTLGTRNVLQASRDFGVDHFVNISTDKAADATSVLGQTKRLAERLTSFHAQESGLNYLSVRFGNVLGSRGSVLFTFRAQIERGGPITVTHPDVTRYFMTIPEACQLVLQAGAIGTPGDVMVLDMGEPVKIVDVAERLIAESGKDISIHFTGLRKGEKLHEVLFSDLEDRAPSAHPLINSVQVPALNPVDVPEQPAGREEVLALLEDTRASVDTALAEYEWQDQ